jgi:hypothetical protein
VLSKFIVNLEASIEHQLDTSSNHPARAAVPAGSSGNSWGGGSFPVPGEQLVEPRGGVVGDAA